MKLARKYVAFHSRKCNLRVPCEIMTILLTIPLLDGQVRRGGHVIIFLCVQFWIRLAAVSYRDKKVRTVASPAAKSINKLRDTRNWVQKEPEYAICVIFTTLWYHKAIGSILCDLVWQIRHNYNRNDDGHCDVTGHRKMSVLGAVGTMMTTHEHFVMMWSFIGPTLFCVL